MSHEKNSAQHAGIGKDGTGVSMIGNEWKICLLLRGSSGINYKGVKFLRGRFLRGKVSIVCYY